NVCNASPSADTLIPLYLYNAKVNLVNRYGRRTLPISEFIMGPGSTELTRGEYLEGVTVSKLNGEYEQVFEKVGRRSALDISVASMGYLLRQEDGVVGDFRLAYGAVAPTVLRMTKAEERLVGDELTREAVEDCKELVEEAVSPISDIRGSAEYREKVSVRLLERLLE
ncbi:MAG: FAD binding domain-containing protein, partial [Candidatus Bipolaricaulota bacterium]